MIDDTNLCDEVIAILIAASTTGGEELSDYDRQALGGLTTALMAAFDRHCDQPVWTETLVRDVTTNILQSLLDGGIPASRARVETALAAAGIAPGEVR